MNKKNKRRCGDLTTYGPVHLSYKTKRLKVAKKLLPTKKKKKPLEVEENAAASRDKTRQDTKHLTSNLHRKLIPEYLPIFKLDIVLT